MKPENLLSAGWVPVAFAVGLVQFKCLSSAYAYAREIATERRYAVTIDVTFVRGSLICRAPYDRVLPEVAVGYAPLNIALKTKFTGVV